MITDKDEVLSLSYDSDLNAVIMKWKGFSSKEQFREANESVLKLLREKNAKKLLADTHHMRIISVQDQQWLYLDWLPRAIKAGLEYVAILESEDFFNRLSVENVVQQVNDKLTIKFFNTLLGARHWLINK